MQCLYKKIGDQSYFSIKLMIVPYLVGFKQPEHLKYDTSKGDIIRHVWEFKNTLLLHQEESLFCKLFPTTFTGKTVTWFVDLKPRSIES